MRSTYTLVHVTHPSGMTATDPAVLPPPDELAGMPADVHSQGGGAAGDYLDLLAHRFREHTASVETRVTHGGAGRAIVELAREVDANLIATGTAARGPLARAFMGSVADKVVRSAQCSVLVVPQAHGVSELSSASAGHSVSERF